MSAYIYLCRRVLVLTFCAILLCVFPAFGADNTHNRALPLKLEGNTRAVGSYMEWLLDNAGSFTIENLATNTMQEQFKAMHMVPFSKQAGVLWLRFTIAAKDAEDLRPATLMLDMGPGVPGTPTLYVPRINPADRSVQWQEQQPHQRSVFILPEATVEPQVCYIRLQGVPGPWFTPTLLSPHDSATALERLAHPAVLVALGMIILLCLLRSLSEHGSWRIWMALYCGAAIAHTWYGTPITPAGHIEMDQAIAVIAPGLALMLLPHVGRQFMHTAHFSRRLDCQYILLSIPGMLTILLPLIPNFTWTVRLLALWPLGILLLLPTTLGAWLGGLVGARRFLLACLLPPIGTAIGLGLPTDIVAPELLASAPMWGVALGALIIASSVSVPLPQQNDSNILPNIQNAPLSITPHEQDTTEEILTLGAPLDNSINTAMLTAKNTPSSTLPSINMPMPPKGKTAIAADTLCLHLDSLIQQVDALRHAQLPGKALHQIGELKKALCTMQPLLGENTVTKHTETTQIFNLQRLLREIHDTAQQAAEGKNTALSWYMPPHMGLWYKGNAGLITDILTALVNSAVQATKQGAIQITVRRMPESLDPGQLVFTITDTGTGLPPYERSALALVRAWEAIGLHHGTLSMEYGSCGTSITFSLCLQAVHQPEAAERLHDNNNILIVDNDPRNRQLLSFMLEDMPCTVREAHSLTEAVTLSSTNPTNLILIDEQWNAKSISAISALRQKEKDLGTTPIAMLGFAENDSQGQALRDAGITLTLVKPITRNNLRQAVAQLLPQALASSATATVAEQAIPDLFGADPGTTKTGKAQEHKPAAQKNATQAIPDLFGTMPTEERKLNTEADMPELHLDTRPGDAPHQVRHNDNKNNSITDLADQLAPSLPAQQSIPNIQADEPYIPKGTLKLDPDAMRDPAIRLVKPTAADKLAVAEVQQRLARTTEESKAASKPEQQATPAVQTLQKTVGEQNDDEGHIRVTPSTEKQRSHVAQQVTENTDIAKANTQQDPVSAALQRVQSLLIARAQKPLEKTDGKNTDEIEKAQVPHDAASASTTTTKITTTPVQQHVNPTKQEDIQRSEAAPKKTTTHTRASQYDPFDGLDEPIRQMLLTFDVNIVRARQAFHTGNNHSVSLLAAGMAQEAEKRGLRVLSRMARCVERAASAGDREALADLLPELEHAVERNRIAFTSDK